MTEQTFTPTELGLTIRKTDGDLIVSSREIAKHFRKRHEQVLRKIKAFLPEVPPGFIEQNLLLSEYKDASGRKNPFYFLTETGFTLVVLGFTGPQFTAIKTRYIEAFQAMRKENQRLRAQAQAAPALPADGRALVKMFLNEPEGGLLSSHFIRRGLHLARRLTPGRRRLIKRAAFYAGLKSTNGQGLTHTEIGRLLRCGADKARLLLQEHAWIGPAAGAGSPPANPGGGHE